MGEGVCVRVCVCVCTHTHTHTHYVYIYDGYTHAHTHTEHCFRALWRANLDEFWDFKSFDPDEYEYYERVLPVPNVFLMCS